MIETSCGVCGRPFTPTPDDDVLDPAADHVCPVCRSGGDLGGYVDDPDPGTLV